jgi:hypothetical protein
MTRRQKTLLFGLPAAAAAIFFVVEAASLMIWDGHGRVTVIVRSKNPLELRRVAYSNTLDKATTDLCLKYPESDGEWQFVEAPIKGPQTFQFDVPTSERTSYFRVLGNRLSWVRYAVFRIETVAGEVIYVAIQLPNLHETSSVTIDVSL